MAPEFKLTERHYQYLFDNANDAIWVHDLEGDIMVANTACEHLTGYSVKELIGTNVSRFLTREYLNKAREIKRKLLAFEPFEQPYENLLVRKDGTVGVMNLSTSLFVSDGEIRGMQNIGRDITEEKRLQRNLRAYADHLRQTQKLDELGEMATSVAHGINNPLAGVLVYNKLISEIIARALAGRDDELAVVGKDILDKLKKIEAAVTHCTHIASGLLDFAKQSEPTPGPVTLRRVVDQALSLVGNQAKLNNVVVTREENDVPPVVADLRQLEQVVVNLIMNAIQAMPRGGQLVIRSYREGKWAKLSVQDTGFGISPENLEKMFTPFFTTKARGTGLGLAISYGIIERHGGKIEVRSEVGRGSNFTIMLPLPQVNVPQDAR